MPTHAKPIHTMPIHTMPIHTMPIHTVPLTVPRKVYPTSRPVRLTRRGRICLLAALVAVLFGAFSLGRSATQAAPVAPAPPAVEHRTVVAGESLWRLAQRLAPANDPREVVAQIRRLNGLTDSQLQVGQQLLLPVTA